jgi:RNA polymerase sigma-70 factor (ECF subfamily)
VPFACVLAAWRDHETELRRFLRHQSHDPHQADDLLQEVFVKAMRQGERFCVLEQPRAWLFQVARHALIDQQRLRRPTEPLPEDWPIGDTDELAPIDRLAAQIEQVLPTLDTDDQHILRCCDLQGQKQHDFAAAQGLSLSAVKSRLLRARKRLRSALQAQCEVRFDMDGRVCCHRSIEP